MARRPTSEQERTIARVMHEFKHGELRRSDGSVVGDPKQAIAVALSEAGASDRVDAATNRRNRRRTADLERRRAAPRDIAEGTSTRAQLHAEARRRGVPGRSAMTKAELQRALSG